MHVIGRMAPACAGRELVGKMYTVCIIKSLDNKWYYVGLSKDANKRLKEHNNGTTRSTRNKAPFKLIFTKKFGSRTKARDFEKFLKIRSNKEKILRKLGEI